mgnify:CR=1 FL=1
MRLAMRGLKRFFETANTAFGLRRCTRDSMSCRAHRVQVNWLNNRHIRKNYENCSCLRLG